MINLPASLTVSACEDALKSLENEEEIRDLIIPVGRKNFTFAGMATAVQFVVTWGRRSKTWRIILKKSKLANAERIKGVVDHPHMLAAAMFGKSVMSQKDGADESVRDQVNLLASERIDQQGGKSYGNQRGRLCWFCFVDHSSKGFDRNFYRMTESGQMEPRKREQIEFVIEAMVKKSTTVAGGAISLSDGNVTYLGKVFYELFLNTHEHGSRQKDRERWLSPGVRLIYTNGINLSEVAIGKVLMRDRVVAQYIKNVNKSGRFIEISIIDSGLGLANRWRADRGADTDSQLDLRSEYELVRKCFSFREGSSGKDEKGNGLPTVMDRLTRLRGFMRLRTGRLSLYRNFAQSPFKGKGDSDLFDWKTQSPSNDLLTESPSVEGVAVTLLIPLDAKA